MQTWYFTAAKTLVLARSCSRVGFAPRLFAVRTRAILLALTCSTANANQATEVSEETFDLLRSMDLQQLLETSVETASGVEETLRDAPASMVVVTAEDMQRRGYMSLDELLADLPGFDLIGVGGFQHVVAYQRGYRVPFMQRTLIMVNGIVDNHLWSHAAQISRQYPLSGLKRVEVLYGPSSAVYGPNAFLGIINLVTKNAAELLDTQHQASATLQIGSYRSRGAEIFAQGREGHWRYNLSGKFFVSDEAGIDDLAPWGFIDENLLSNRDLWGAMLDLQQNGRYYGEFYDPSKNWGLLGEISYQDFTFGTILWDTSEGYGRYYPSDRTQPNANWNHNARQFYLQHSLEASEKLMVKSQIAYHSNRLWGNWAEATEDWNPGMSHYSYLTLSDWNSQNHSWLFKQDYDYQFSHDLRVTGGLKYEKKQLTKAYDLCSYWSGTFCSTDPGHDGPHGQGPGIFHSLDPVALVQPGTLHDMPAANLATLRDYGIYFQAIWDKNLWRLLGGLRYDRNSLYGSTINPRLSAIYRWSPDLTLKLVYGRAFQEPSPIQLWGGWIGRTGNPDLRPEKAENLEFILMYQQQRWLHEASLFAAHYRDVIKEEAENAGSRDIVGLEYRGRYRYPNFIKNAPDIQGYLYYTYTHARSSVTYNQTAAAWLDESSTLGDIAPHKLNLGMDIPLNAHWHVNLRSNYVSNRLLYSRNPLREAGRKAEAYTLFNLAVGYQKAPLSLAFKIENLFDVEYYHPGMEQADSGDDFSQRSQGFRNSLLPQEKRSFWLNLRWDWK